jgi:hypothetical protein
MILGNCQDCGAFVKGSLCGACQVDRLKKRTK